MKWLVTGASGLLGTEVCEVARMYQSIDLVPASKDNLDVTDIDSVTSAVKDCAVVLNTAAWTNVDKAEESEDQAFAVNYTGVTNLAEACKKYGAILIHVSTGAVLSDSPREQSECSAVCPINAYARSKACGESSVLHILPDTGYVVRTSWLYGSYGKNFISTMIDLANDQDHLSVVADQWGQPTWARSLAQRILDLGHAAQNNQASSGIYHGVSSGKATWFELAQEAFKLVGLSTDILQPIGMSEFPRKSFQLKYNLLSQEKWQHIGLGPLDDWRKMLKDALAGKDRL